MDIGTAFCGTAAEGAEPAAWDSAVSCTPTLDIKGACVVAAVLLLLLATAIGRLSDESNAVFGFAVDWLPQPAQLPGVR